MDYLIVGAGPAGLQLGLQLQQAGHDYLILEAGPAPGQFFQRYPRHRKLISINKRYTGSDDAEQNLRMDWNSLLGDPPEHRFTGYSPRYFPPADALVRYLADYAERHRLRVLYNTPVQQIARDGDFIVSDGHGHHHRARRLVMATGVSLPQIPAIEGIETAERYADVSIEAEEFTDQRVLIIGKGNSAFETADHLMETAAVIHVAGPSPIRFAWRTHYVGHLRAVNNNLLDSYQLKSQNALLDGNILAIRKAPNGYTVSIGFSRANEVVKDLHYDRVIACTGFRFDASMFDPQLRPQLTINDRFPAQTAAWESTNVPDLYFAGTLMQVRDFKKSTSGFIHGFRYGVRALQKVLDERYHDRSWPHRPLSATSDALMEALLERANRSSALWQQFGFLADVVTVEPQGEARYHEEMPVDYLHQLSALASHPCCFVMTLEYGPDHDQVDPFDLSTHRIAQTDHQRAAEGQYLHPVVRHYRHGQWQATHHVTENLENDWSAPHHRDPLAAFLRQQTTTPMEVAA